jgi:hydrogenase nickel insertion protein HypA
MDEFSISSEIVKTVLDTAERNHGKKVFSVQLEIGELTHLNGEQVAFWVKELFKDSVAEGAEVKIKAIKARIHCIACGYRGGQSDLTERIHSSTSLSILPKCQSFQWEAIKFLPNLDSTDIFLNFKFEISPYPLISISPVSPSTSTQSPSDILS